MDRRRGLAAGCGDCRSASAPAADRKLQPLNACNLSPPRHNKPTGALAVASETVLPMLPYVLLQVNLIAGGAVVQYLE